MKKVKVIVFSGYGINCEEETAFAFGLAGAEAKIVHINDAAKNPKSLRKYQILAIPGGFSYGDDLGSGYAYAGRMRNCLWDELLEFIKKEKLIIGICNGFQILVNLGLIPALNNFYGQKQVALTHNNNARYTVRWVDLKTENSSPWLRKIKNLSIPIAHGEGRFFTDETILKQLKKKKQIALKYTNGGICRYQNLPANPNGSLDDIAGITDESGRIFGLMPHPERAIFFHQLPNWPLLKEKLKRENKHLPKFGPGLQIFKNGVNFLSA